MTRNADNRRPEREVRAVFDADTIRVYQAYRPAIARAALREQRFVPPFKRERMTWIKPSFLWMAYRCGWGRKPGQERVLAIDIRRTGFEWALGHAALSHHDPALHASYDAWRETKDASPVRVQWDPERDVRFAPLPHRSLQVGLGGESVARYVEDWTVAITDLTETFAEAGRLIDAGEVSAAEARVPEERPYPLPAPLRRRLGASAG